MVSDEVAPAPAPWLGAWVSGVVLVLVLVLVEVLATVDEVDVAELGVLEEPDVVLAVVDELVAVDAVVVDALVVDVLAVVALNAFRNAVNIVAQSEVDFPKAPRTPSA